MVLITFLLSSLLFAQPQDTIVGVGACATPGIAFGVYVQEQYAYIADVGGVTSIDISLPSSPSVLDFLNQNFCEASGIYIKDTLAYLNVPFLGPSFTIINIKNPSSLARVSWVQVPLFGGDDPKGIFVRDSLGYFADSDGGFLIINISDLLDPEIICTLDTPGRVIDLFVRDTLAYLADMFSLLIVNVKNPYDPAIIGSLSIGGWGVYDVWVSGDYAFVTEADEWNGYGKVNMVNVSDPAAPFIVDQVSMPGTPYGLFVVDDKIYVAADDWWAPPRLAGEGRADIEGGIRIVHWEPPDIMNLLDNVDTPGRCRDIFAVDSFIYIAAWDSFMIYKYRSTAITENDKKLVLLQSLSASPNPFSHQTKISFTITAKSFVSVEISDTQGRKIKDLASRYFIPGHYEVVWNGKDDNELEVASGVYYAKLTAQYVATRSTKHEKVIYIK